MTNKMLDEVMIALDAANGDRDWPQLCTPIQANIKCIADRVRELEAANAELQRQLEQAQRAAWSSGWWSYQQAFDLEMINAQHSHDWRIEEFMKNEAQS